jgi:hypothetical protein
MITIGQPVQTAGNLTPEQVEVIKELARQSYSAVISAAVQAEIIFFIIGIGVGAAFVSLFWYMKNKIDERQESE